MGNEQFSALIDLLNFCRRSERTRQVDVKEWQRLRGRMNKAFQTPGPPRIKPDYGLISDLMKGVPVEVARKRYKVSRGTVYRMIREHPELAKMWEPKFKKWAERRAKKEQQPDAATSPVPDSAPVRPSTPPLPDVLFQLLAAYQPTIASPTSSVRVQRGALRVLLSNLGLVQLDEFDAMTDEELVTRVTAYQSKGENQWDEAVADDLSFCVSVGDVDDFLTVVEASELIAGEITQKFEPFVGIGADHPFFSALRSVLKKLAVAGHTLQDDDIPDIARKAVGLVKDKVLLPPKVLRFAGLAPAPANPEVHPRPDAVESSSPPPTEASGHRIQLKVRDVDAWLITTEAAKVIAEEITQNLEPFAEMDPDHEFFRELPSLADRITSGLMMRGCNLISDSDIPEFAKWAVVKTKSKMSFPPEVWVFVGLIAQGAGQQADEATTDLSARAILSELLSKRRPKAASGG